MKHVSLMSRAELVCELITSTPMTNARAAATYAKTRDPALAGDRDALVSYKLAVARELLLRDLAERMKSEPVLTAPGTVRDWLRMYCANLEHEVFIILLLDLCALVKNVELAGQRRAAEHCAAPALHINLVKAVATSVRLPACRALLGLRVAEPARREILGRGLGA
jgi:hypothetical protein